jgi:hypothetical protein
LAQEVGAIVGRDRDGNLEGSGGRHAEGSLLAGDSNRAQARSYLGEGEACGKEKASRAWAGAVRSANGF